MKFDAYAGNIFGGDHPAQVAEVVAFGAGCRVARGKPRRRYSDCFDIKDGAAPVAWFGYDRTIEATYFEGKGERTPQVVESIRKHWAARHNCARADVAEDYLADDAYPRLQAAILRARDPRVDVRQIGPLVGDGGRTTYAGSPSSRVMTRLYEAGKMPERLHFGTPNWVRLELQARPGKAVEKRRAATMQPVEFWGMAKWSQRLVHQLGAVDVPRFAPPSAPVEFERTWLYVARTYRRFFEEALGDFGSWECVGREIEEVWRQDDAARCAATGGGSS